MDKPKENKDEAFNKFKDFARKIVQVPKAEADAVERKTKKGKPKKKKGA